MSLSSFLLSIGNAAEKLLPDIISSFSCCAVPAAGIMNIFSLSSGHALHEKIASLSSEISAANALFSKAGETNIFPCGFTFDACIPSFRTAAELSSDPADSLLIAALRGKDLPFSLQTDREAVEWCFSDLLCRLDDPSVRPFASWLDQILRESELSPVRLTCMADLADPFSAGITLSLLHYFRKIFINRPVSVFLLAIAEPTSPSKESFFSTLRSSLQAIDSRGLLRQSDTDSLPGTHAAWLLSMPSSMIESDDSFRFIAPHAAKIISHIFTKKDLPAPGIHTVETEGTLALSMLGNQSSSFVASMNLYVWLLTDVLPSVRNYLSHPARLRSIAMNPKTATFRHLFSSGSPDQDDPSASVDLVEKAVKSTLSVILSYMRSIPSTLRISPWNFSLWQQAVEACGRYITVAAEYDTSLAEAHESGLDSVRPVHRVSMADTEEEKLVRRLEDMKLQLDHESGSRDEILRSIGGFRSMQVRMDCLNRCRTALHEARSRSAEAIRSSDHLTVLKHERRIRLLEAAVSRCKSEFSSDSIFHTVSDRPYSHRQEEDPYTGTFLLPETCHILEKLITAETSEPVSRIPALFTESAEADSRTRWKSLQAFCRNENAASPFELIVSQAYKICSDEISSSRFLSRGDMPDLPLLPDLLPSAPLIRICDILSILPPTPEDSDRPSELRGLLSMLLIRHYRRISPEEAVLRCECCAPGASPVLRYWLEANQADKVYILSLSRKTDSAPFALVLPGKTFISAKRTGVHTRLVPAFTTWFDSEQNRFADPCAFLGEGDRKLLAKCLDSYTSSLSCNDCGSPLLTLLSDFREDLSSENKPRPEDPSLRTRIRAVCGLPSLSAYASSFTFTTCYYEHFLSEDMIGICLTGISEYPAFSCSDIPEEKLYQYRGVPFAREDSALLLAGSCVPGEEYTLKRLETECSVLSDYSDDFRDALLKNIPDLLERYPDVFPEVRESAEKLITDASDPVGKKEPVFEWPWDTSSPSILTVLRECIGDSLPASGMRPFSERLAIFPARGRDVIGDAMLSSMCSIPPFEGYGENADIAPDAVLPPLSPEFGYDLCRIPEGRTLSRSGLLRFERNMNDTIRVTLTLDGSFPVRLVRVYSPDEILYLYSHDIPTVAVWPSVPFAA